MVCIGAGQPHEELMQRAHAAREFGISTLHFVPVKVTLALTLILALILTLALTLTLASTLP